MDFDRIQLKESPAVSGRSKSGDVAAVALLSKGYGDIALVILGGIKISNGAGSV